MPGDERFEMGFSVPGDARLLRPVRLAIGGLATLAGFDVEAIDDLRIGADEICGALLDGGDGTDLELSCTVVVGRSLTLTGKTAKGAMDGDLSRFVFSERLLSVVADSHALEVGDAEVTCWLERLVP